MSNKTKTKTVKMCECCHEKKATIHNPNGQWCCRRCNQTVTWINKCAGRLYDRMPEFRKLYNQQAQSK